MTKTGLHAALILEYGRHEIWHSCIKNVNCTVEKGISERSEFILIWISYIKNVSIKSSKSIYKTLYGVTVTMFLIALIVKIIYK